jgi:hypothetical protein
VQVVLNALGCLAMRREDYPLAEDYNDRASKL